MSLLLDAFYELLNHSYDKELNMYADWAGQAVHAELRARGFDWVDALEGDADRPRDADMVISEPGAKDLGLSPTAFKALNEMLRDYDFGDGRPFLENVLQALRAIAKPTASQTRLRRQLDAISFEARESASRRIRVIRRD
jgi:hypothetical protein